MAELKDIILKIGADVDTAYVEYEKLKKNIDALKKANKELDLTTEHGKKTFDENANAIKQNQETMVRYEKIVKSGERTLKVYAQSNKEAAKVIGDVSISNGVIIEANKNVDLSYRQMIKTIKDQSAINVRLKTDIEEKNKELENEIRLNGENTENAKLLTKEIETLNNQYKAGVQANKDMAASAGELKLAQDQATAAVKYASDQAAGMKSLISAAKLGVSVYGAWQSASALMGIENQSLDKTMKTLTATITFLISIQKIQQALSVKGNLMTGIAVLQSKALAVANTLQAKSWIGAGTAMGIFNAIATANPLVLIAAALAAVVLGIYAFTRSTKKHTDEQINTNKTIEQNLKLLERSKDINKEVESIMEREIERMRNQGKTTTEIKKAEKELADLRLASATERRKQNQTEADELNENKKALDGYKDKLDELKQKREELGKNKKIEFEGETRKIDDVIKEMENKVKGFDTKVKIGIEVTADEKAAQQALQDISDKEIAERKKRAEDAKKISLDNEKKIRDLTLLLLKEGENTEKQIREAKLKDDLEAIVGNEKQKAELKKLLTEQYNNYIKAIEDKYSEDALKKAEEVAKEELRIKIEISKQGSEERYNLELERLEKEKQAAITAATKKGVSVELVEAEFEAKSAAMKTAFEDEKKAKAKEAAQLLAQEKQLEFENELLRLGENEDAKAQLIIEREQAKLDELVAMDAAAKKALGLTDLQYTNLVLQQQQKVDDAVKNSMKLQQQRTQQLFSNLSTLKGAMSDILSAIAGDNEEFTSFKKALALVEIGINTATAISGAIAAATPGDPYTVAIRIAAAVASAIAGMTAALNQINKQNVPSAPKFASGVFNIQGAGTGTSDSIPANLSKGETVIRAKTTAAFPNILQAIESFMDGKDFKGMNQAVGLINNKDDMYLAVKAALKEELPNIPPQYVAVTEINEVGERVVKVNDLRYE